MPNDVQIRRDFLKLTFLDFDSLCAIYVISASTSTNCDLSISKDDNETSALDTTSNGGKETGESKTVIMHLKFETAETEWNQNFSLSWNGRNKAALPWRHIHTPPRDPLTPVRNH